MRAMNYREKLIGMIKLLYAESEAVLVNKRQKRRKLKNKGRGVKQGCPLSLYLFIIVLELMAIEMRNKEGMKGIEMKKRDKEINSISNKRY